MAERGLTYVSTRGGAEGMGFADVLLRGLADDGGLFVPSSWPSLGVDDLADDAGYVEVAQRGDVALRRRLL